jgi:hypothetical protein
VTAVHMLGFIYIYVVQSALTCFPFGDGIPSPYSALLINWLQLALIHSN